MSDCEHKWASAKYGFNREVWCALCCETMTEELANEITKRHNAYVKKLKKERLYWKVLAKIGAWGDPRARLEYSSERVEERLNKYTDLLTRLER